ncbi:MAG: indolepyruvate ferredoxin oxidoreductase subunit beta [Phycisphaerales bacterium]|nr:MAG: indolepyruvate ferredoxin oxidoreductase subunit beta [Phycisphaerales bacterium]
MAEKTDIFITGVGGQGSLSASTFLGQAAVEAGLKVLVGEIHGMAQRGGVVESSVRIGEVYGPIVSDGQADILLGFEPIETLRAMTKASEKTLVVTNTHPVVPAMVSMKGDKYPDTDEVLGRIRAISPNVIAFDATETAKQAGNAQALNAVLLGVLAGAGVLPFVAEILRKVVLDGVPEKARDVNEKAFAMGMEMAAKQTPAPCA